MTPKQLAKLRARNEADVRTIRRLLCEYRLTGDREMAEFVEHYTRSLELDFELAAAEGEHGHLQRIAEDIEALRDDTAQRVERARLGRAASSSRPLVC
ncbi:hypothetical protein [Truepera radiovictrix]|uniref:Uncharacterized protein n=1 Tax=Truepera radiovictrix (strain DSM 17093 / CIP 108686 / LMG 22925 / RQ-24) TaxID=649638 RepID=D7CXR0_TRURR|nr:hypothetical protein [Truepera radiovictrix]ADI14662.1 conserved hypothetical protein [Truepera radiovictrix DSM 17093]WMT56788.1 hypothetical protein RCV51_12315 [Truepera radiovictrix]